MSEMEYNEGRLIPIDEDIEENIDKWISDEEFSPQSKWYASKMDLLRDEPFEAGLYCLNGRWYKAKMERSREYEPPEIIKFIQHSDGSIEFATYHYNGSGTWSEVIEERLKEITSEAS